MLSEESEFQNKREKYAPSYQLKRLVWVYFLPLKDDKRSLKLKQVAELNQINQISEDGSIFKFRRIQPILVVYRYLAE